MMTPVLYEEIFSNGRYFMFPRWRFTNWLQIVDPDEEEETKKRNGYFETLFRGLQRPPEGVLLAVLGELFPAVDSYLTGNQIAAKIAQDPDGAERQRRIYHPDFFPRYFIFNVPADLFGEKELSTFINDMNDKSEVAQCVAVFKAKYAELSDLHMKRWDFLRRVNSSMIRFNAIAKQALAIGTEELSDKLEEATAAGSFDELTGMRIVFSAANQLQATVGAQAVLESVIRDSVSDRFATQVLNEVESKRNRFLEYGSVVHKSELEKAFRERMNMKYGPGREFSFFREQIRADLTPLGRWALCGAEGRNKVHQYLRREFEARHSNVGSFLSHFFLANDTNEAQDPRAQDPVGTIDKIYFPVQELRKLLDEYGDSAYSSPEEARSVQEFNKSRYKDNDLKPNT
jgi:hypothetical protein